MLAYLQVLVDGHQVAVCIVGLTYLPGVFMAVTSLAVLCPLKFKEKMYVLRGLVRYFQFAITLNTDFAKFEKLRKGMLLV